MAIKTGKELAAAAEAVAKKHKTLYVMGCFGAPMTAGSKERYIQHDSYNQKTVRTVKIKSASTDTFGFDCIGLIKGLLWGWDGDTAKVYGGAKYKENDVPDKGANQTIKLCEDVSTDFSTIQVGEAVWMSGHIGVYIGNGLAVESTPAWADGVQITAVHNIGKKTGYNGRRWTKHGKLPWVTYETTEAAKPATKPTTAPSYDLEQFIRDVQAAIGAKVDGKAGPETLSKTPTLSAMINRKHPAVKAVQKRLAELGYYQVGKADGVAGPKFTGAVMAYQDATCRVSDGIITARNETWRKLLGMR